MGSFQRGTGGGLGSARRRKQAGLLVKALPWDAGELGSSLSPAADTLGESVNLPRPLFPICKMEMMLLHCLRTLRALQWDACAPMGPSPQSLTQHLKVLLESS